VGWLLLQRPRNRLRLRSRVPQRAVLALMHKVARCVLSPADVRLASRPVCIESQVFLSLLQQLKESGAQPMDGIRQITAALKDLKARGGTLDEETLSALDVIKEMALECKAILLGR